MDTSNIHAVELVFLLLLLFVAVFGFLAHKLRLPYPIVLTWREWCGCRLSDSNTVVGNIRGELRSSLGLARLGEDQVGVGVERAEASSDLGVENALDHRAEALI